MNEKRAAIQKAIWQTIHKPRSVRCKLPPAGPRDTIILLSPRTVGPLADVTIAGQDALTLAPEIHIEPGKEPLYIVVMYSRVTLWRFTGATERVSRFVTVPAREWKKGPFVGVTGLAKDRLTYLTAGHCVPRFKAGTPKEDKARAVVEKALKRKVSDAIALSALTRIALPSGLVTKVPRNYYNGLTIDFKSMAAGLHGTKDPIRSDGDKALNLPHGIDRKAYEAAIDPNYSGLVHVDPAKVITPGKAEKYLVPPGWIGLIRLIHAGFIEPQPDGTLTIRKPIPHFPAGVWVMRPLVYRLAKGVALPAGLPGNGCVISGETGKPVLNPIGKRCPVGR